MEKSGHGLQEVRSSLPEDLQLAFDELIIDYQESAKENSRRPWVNYRILADLVRKGWRKPD